MPKIRSPVVIALIAINVVMFAIEIAAGADAISPTPQQLLPLGADYGPLTLHGEPWRLVSSMFLHFGVLHIAMNMICLWGGRIVEEVYGHVGFVAIYLASGLLGGIASLARSSVIVSAGASGAVFGVFGAFGAYLVMRRDRLDPVALRNSSKSLVTFIGLNLVIGFSVSGIDVTAHMGGLVAGFLAGVGLLAGASSERQRITRSLAIAVAGIALSFGALQIIPSSGSHPSIAVARIVELNNDMFTKRKQLDEQLDAKQITQTSYYETLERDMIPAWHAARLQLDGVTVAPEGRVRLEKLRTYVWLEEAELQALSDMLRDGKAYDEDARRSFTEKEQAASEARRDFQDDIKNVTTE